MKHKLHNKNIYFLEEMCTYEVIEIHCAIHSQYIYLVFSLSLFNAMILDVVAEDGTINRLVLGPKVFSDPARLQKLNEIVWPSIQRLAQAQIKEYKAQGKSIMNMKMYVHISINQFVFWVGSF